jgi:7-cyano-7-deazaguanine synthase
MGLVSEATLLLLSGGIDSACLAASLRPQQTLFIDYGQQPAAAERRAAEAIARELELPFHHLRVDMRPLGSGILAGVDAAVGAPSPEWWPFRNQLLVSLAAAWAVSVQPATLSEIEHHTVITGTVLTDGERHRDGTGDFYEALDRLLRTQEGGFGVEAPAIQMDTATLVRSSGIADSVLAWTHSCHRGNTPCMECPGCYKRERVLTEVNRLQ